MSPREKKLLIFFGLAGFIILNLFGFSKFSALRLRTNNERLAAQQALDTAEMFRSSREQVTSEMEWLQTHMPEPAAYQDIQTQLQQLADREARNLGLTIRSRPLPTNTEGTYFHRAKMQFTITAGNEQSLYRWFDKLNVPDELRAATMIRLSPNREDDTKIDCTAEVEQWFVPLAPSA